MTRAFAERRLPPHVRAAITVELNLLLDRVDVLLARLDDAEPDPDLEEDDHSGDPLELVGEALDDDGRGIMPTRPLYATDQSAGPINYAEAQSAYRAEETRLIYTSGNSWRRAA